MAKAIDVLFLDVGGVILTNGWDRAARKRAAERFRLDRDEMDERHQLTFDTYEEGKLSLDEYMSRVVFYERRDFTPADFRAFMLAQSAPLSDMIDFVRRLKERHGLRVVAISNEGLELTCHRIAAFGLREFIDFFVFSCFVHMRKPDKDLYRLALNMAQAAPEQAAYVDDRALFAAVASELGIRGIHHTTLEGTRRALARLGLPLD